jgi:hypothetical protein
LALATDSLRIQFKPASLYLGEWLRGCWDRDVFGDDYEQGNLYVCSAVAGVVYLAGVVGVWPLAASQCPWHDVPCCIAKPQAVRCLVVFFLLVVSFFLVLPGGTRFDPFWWPSISLIPAVVCAGGAIDRLTADRRLLQAAVVLVLLGLGVRSLVLLRNPGPLEPRATVSQFVDDFLQKGNEALRRHDLGEAQYRFIYALNIGGPCPEAYDGLAQIARERNGH